LLVTASIDLEDIALEFLAKSITKDLLGYSFVKEGTQLLVVIYLELLLAPGGRVGDVELRREDKKTRTDQRSNKQAASHESRRR